jgi:CTP synthase (UTP-ammonia lyase)
VSEALRAGGFANLAKIEIAWIASDECETPEGAKKYLEGVDAICVPGGFGCTDVCLNRFYRVSAKLGVSQECDHAGNG